MKWVPLVKQVGPRRWIRVGVACVEVEGRIGPEIFVDEVADEEGWLYPKYQGHYRPGYRIVAVERSVQEELW